MKPISPDDYNPLYGYHYSCINCNQKYEAMPGAAITVQYVTIGDSVFMAYNCKKCGGNVIIKEVDNG